MNAKMPALQAALTAVGFVDVKTVLSSGNVLFSARVTTNERLARKCEKAMTAHLDRMFLTLVLPVKELRALIEADPWKGFPVRAGTKRMVTFLYDPPTPSHTFPVERAGATIFGLKDRVVFSAYGGEATGPLLMNLLEKVFGKRITTRTWDTVNRLAR